MLHVSEYLNTESLFVLLVKSQSAVDHLVLVFYQQFAISNQHVYIIVLRLRFKDGGDELISELLMIRCRPEPNQNLRNIKIYNESLL